MAKVIGQILNLTCLGLNGIWYPFGLVGSNCRVPVAEVDPGSRPLMSFRHSLYLAATLR